MLKRSRIVETRAASTVTNEKKNFKIVKFFCICFSIVSPPDSLNFSEILIILFELQRDNFSTNE